MFRLVHKYEDPEIEKRLKVVKDLDVFDDVWIKENNEIYYGWIYEITRRHITVVYDNAKRDYKFHTEKQSKQTEIKQDNKVLYCNDPNKDDN